MIIKTENGNTKTSDGEKNRQGWDEAFREMAESNDDILVIPAVFDDEDIKDCL